MAVTVHRLVVLLRRCGQDTEPMRLLPFRRFSAAILPVVGCSALAPKPLLDLRGGVIGKLFSEGHGQTIHGKNKSAMPKIILAIRRQCRHITRMSNGNLQPLVEKFAALGYRGKELTILVLSAAYVGAIAFGAEEAAAHYKARIAETEAMEWDSPSFVGAPEWRDETAADREVASYKEGLNHGWN